MQLTFDQMLIPRGGQISSSRDLSSTCAAIKYTSKSLRCNSGNKCLSILELINRESSVPVREKPNKKITFSSSGFKFLRLSG